MEVGHSLAVAQFSLLPQVFADGTRHRQYSLNPVLLNAAHHAADSVRPPLLNTCLAASAVIDRRPPAQVLRALWCAGVPMRSQHVVALLAAGLQVLAENPKTELSSCKLNLISVPLQLPPVVVRAQFLKILSQCVSRPRFPNCSCDTCVCSGTCSM